MTAKERNWELELWRKVIIRAQKEAQSDSDIVLGPDDSFDAAHYRRIARRWLTTPSRSYYQVCAYAELSGTEARYLQEQERKKYPCSS